MMSNRCLTANDSAATAPRPPGLASFAKVQQMGNQDEQFSHEKDFNAEIRFLKTALRKRFQAKSAIRHTQFQGAAGWTRR